jgi:hypothetical protein
MIEKIYNKNDLIAIVVRAAFDGNGIEFFTDNDQLLQFGYMKRDQGYKIQPHIHKSYPRVTNGTQEVLYVKFGKVKVIFYDDNKQYVSELTICTGDWILLASQGHGFEFIENSVLLEVKNGPYAGDEDKIKFTV